MTIRSLLVLCEGNICRSPMAQGILAKEFSNSTVTAVGSAGQPIIAPSPADVTVELENSLANMP